MFFLTNSSQLINLNLHKPKLLYIGDRQYVHHTRFIEALSLDFCIKTAFIQEEPIEEDSGFSPEIVICSPLLEPLIYAVKNYQVPIIGICWAQELNEPRSVLKQNSDFSKFIYKNHIFVIDRGKRTGFSSPAFIAWLLCLKRLIKLFCRALLHRNIKFGIGDKSILSAFLIFDG